MNVASVRATEDLPAPTKINWSKAVSDGSTQCYSNKVHSQISPLLSSYSTSIDLNNEITYVANMLNNTAIECLPLIKRRRKKYILDHKLSLLCKESKSAWKCWKGAGRPTYGPTYDEKCSTKRAVCRHITVCRARKERSEIQKRDLLFKKKDRRCFRTFKQSAECSKLLDSNDQLVTDPVMILEIFCSYFSDLASTKKMCDGPVASAAAKLINLEMRSNANNDQILDTEITVEEIEKALHILKLGRSDGTDGLKSEHLLYGGYSLKLWLKTIFNAIIAHESIPPCLKEGVVVPIYKGKGKDLLLSRSYCGITLSSTIAKTLEVMLLKHMSPILHERGFPDINQTAYQKGISCADATFSTQEVLLNYIRQGSNSLLCLYDIEKAFDSVEFPVLLDHLYSAGINGKAWRLIKSWYHSPISRVRLNGALSTPFDISRGVKQGSVLSPSLFLIVMNSLLQRMRPQKYGASLHGYFAGTAVHADDVRSIAPMIRSITQQATEINSFVSNVGLSLNISKLDLIQFSQTPKDPIRTTICNQVLHTKKSVRCLGTQWSVDLSAKDSVKININKAQTAFFGLGSIGAFHGKLNPLSGSSIFDTCIVPILLFGCETWILDTSILDLLERFQCEIGRRILKLSKFHATDTIRIALHWPSVATRILNRKLTVLSKLLSSSEDTLSSRVFKTLSMEDEYSISIVQ